MTHPRGVDLGEAVGHLIPPWTSSGTQDFPPHCCPQMWTTQGGGQMVCLPSPVGAHSVPKAPLLSSLKDQPARGPAHLSTLTGGAQTTAPEAGPGCGPGEGAASLVPRLIPSPAGGHDTRAAGTWVCVRPLRGPLSRYPTPSSQRVAASSCTPTAVPSVGCRPPPLRPRRASRRVPAPAQYLRSLFLEATPFQAVRKAMDAGWIPTAARAAPRGGVGGHGSSSGSTWTGRAGPARRLLPAAARRLPASQGVDETGAQRGKQTSLKRSCGAWSYTQICLLPLLLLHPQPCLWLCVGWAWRGRPGQRADASRIIRYN
ncbi:uncharacterized protein LOC115297682 [Suricata suricatta]|uniref:uncharacterized protein LOC115297682 n=1 Tax=Suricata suricatta TaxID=37032 RepID=UPI001155B1F5|nr:uncharacterized protein LOC115297682 [Suricata suricatta]